MGFNSRHEMNVRFKALNDKEKGWITQNVVWTYCWRLPYDDIFSIFLIQVEIQKLRLYCDPHQSERETACEIYSVVRPPLSPTWIHTGHTSNLKFSVLLRVGVWGYNDNKKYFVLSFWCCTGWWKGECSFLFLSHLLSDFAHLATAVMQK